MPYITRNGQGHINGVFAAKQFDGQEFIDGEVSLYQPTLVPCSITKRQAREVLIRNGMISGVEAAINAIPDTLQREWMRNYWDNSQVFERDRPALLQLAGALGLTAAQLDEMFIYANTL